MRTQRLQQIKADSVDFRHPQIAVAHLGPRRRYAVPALLQRAGMLAHFYTDAYVGRGSAWHVLARLGFLTPKSWQPLLFRKLLSRQEDRLPAEKITAFNLLGLSYASAQKHAGNEEELNNVFMEYGGRFCELIINAGLKEVDGIYAFEGAALPLFLRAQNFSITKILDKFSFPQLLDYELVSEEHRLWPGWESPYPKRAAFQKKFDWEQAECDAADAIICGSDFVAQGMVRVGVRPTKLHTVPYALELSKFSARRQPWDGHRPLRLLFVGGINLRKGVQYFYAALQKMGGNRVDARMVGGESVLEPYLGLLRSQAQLTGQVPRQEVVRHYEWADVFVFPSICEGSATVTYEAMAAGLPVITTPNAGSVVREGVDGFIVPIRDAEAIAARIERLLGDGALLQRMSENARARAEDFSWPKYEERLVAAIRKITA
jgi:glycosyltransferase involved in cell wall biosynthesis